MRELFQELTKKKITKNAKDKLVPQNNAQQVNSLENLIEEVAKLSYIHKDWLLFFRGQHKDYKNSRNSKSTFLPSIYRTKKGKLSEKECVSRFSILEGASHILVKLLERKNILGYQDVKLRKEIQWSILQHYEVCYTPYLDLTQSLSVACSFAVLPDKKTGERPGKGLLFVFALPYFSNRISINSEHDLINIRLLSICPPAALRPHHQEGFLVGTTNIAEDYTMKHELDFNRRLIAKFEFKNDDTFWGNNKPSQKEKDLLYPPVDTMDDLCQKIKNIKESGFFKDPIKSFKLLWQELETFITPLTPDNKSVKEKLTDLRLNYNIDVLKLKEIHELCVFKDKLYKDKLLSHKQILDKFLILYLLMEQIEENKPRIIAER